MKFNFTGKNMAVNDNIKERATQKISRLSRLFPQDVEINVTFSSVKQSETVEVTIPLNKRILRAEITSNDMFASIDEVVDVLERQMVKYKKRLKDKSRRDKSFYDEFVAVAANDDTPAEASERFIEKTKKFALKPMDAEEAVMEMEMLGHNFFVFRNGQTDEVNVVYKRNNGSYGLIEPEY